MLPAFSLVLVRHGRTAWNASGRFQGHADPPLDRVGRRQAREAAAALAPLEPRLVVSSDLRRAHQTAAVIAARCRVPLYLTPALREIELGAWQGLTREAAAARFPDEYAAWHAQPDDPHLRRGGGERLDEVSQRVVAVLSTIVARDDGLRPVVVVSHGIALQAALRHLVGDIAGDPPHLVNGGWLVVHLPRVGATSSARPRQTA
jgi:probable phosphoglycerate mutase